MTKEQEWDAAVKKLTEQYKFAKLKKITEHRYFGLFMLIAAILIFSMFV